jgi:hypothetical protein
VSWAQYRITLEEKNDDETLELLSLGQEEHDIRELARRRRIGDKNTWVINMDTQGLKTPEVPDAVLESTTFRLVVASDGGEDGGKASRYSIRCDDSLNYPVLRYRYVTLNDLDKHEEYKASYYCNRLSALWDRMNEITRLQLSLMPKNDRPAQYSEVLDDVWLAAEMRGKFELPSTWNFYDDEVTAFLDKTWEVQQKIDRKEEAARKAKFKALTSQAT